MIIHYFSQLSVKFGVKTFSFIIHKIPSYRRFTLFIIPIQSAFRFLSLFQIVFSEMNKKNTCTWKSTTVFIDLETDFQNFQKISVFFWKESSAKILDTFWKNHTYFSLTIIEIRRVCATCMGVFA